MARETAGLTVRWNSAVSSAPRKGDDRATALCCSHRQRSSSMCEMRVWDTHSTDTGSPSSVYT